MDNSSNFNLLPLVNRRAFLATSSLLLVGCGTKKVTSVLPSPIWDRSSNPDSIASVPTVLPQPTLSIGAISRASWARGNPIPRNMNKMLPVKYITVHHDGMSSFTNTTKSAAASRLETIRRSNLRRDGGRWGDIGYHFAIDPSGRLWEGRPLAWQGAHVRARNEGNIGVVVLGNFEKQSVNRAQQGAVLSTIQTLMARFRVPLTRVRTHQEWAATACPGRSLQKVTTYLRKNALKQA
ncbi:N-acetylmuramoyl-L-alanine amidase [PVC group bacterium]|nr:N-acetylmuramoyl-L-alanine amidase [PVC group bacterium]